MNRVIRWGALVTLAGLGLGPFADPSAARVAGKEDGLVLVIRADRAVFGEKEPEPVRFTAMLLNKGKGELTLVSPGDGSDCGWRTPVVGWSVVKVSADDPKAGKHPDKVPLHRGARCGNVNALKPDEVFSLKPGEFKELGGWVSGPTFPGPGTYRVVFYYQNDPALAWKGLPLGRHDPGAMERVRKSHKCLLRSNELLVTVTKAK